MTENNSVSNNSGSVMKGIVDSWALLDFAKAHGKMQVGEFTSSETGETFKSCIFTDPANPDSKCFVAFSSKLGTLTPREISERKKSLQVVELEGGHYRLCNKGANAWEDVEL